MRKQKKSIADYITAVAALVWFISASTIDSESWIPFAACLLSTLWLALYAHVYNTKQARRDAST